MRPMAATLIPLVGESAATARCENITHRRLPLGILEREIMVPGRVDLVVGQFPVHRHYRQRIRIQQLLDVGIELRYGK